MVLEKYKIQIPFILIFSIIEYPKKELIINFKTKNVKLTKLSNLSDNHYKIKAPVWLYDKIVNKKINWHDFVLSFRCQIIRKPDIYSTLLQGYILSEKKELKYMFSRNDLLINNQERIQIKTKNCNYMINRYCHGRKVFFKSLVGYLIE